MNKTRLTIFIAVEIVILCVVIFRLFHTPSSEPADPGPDNPAPTASPGGESWNIFRGDSSLSGIAEGSLPDSLKVAWKFKTEDIVTSSAVIAGSRVFVGSFDGFIYAIDLKTGKQIWAYETDDAIEAAPFVHEATVYAGSDDSFLYALDAETGDLKWSFETGDKIIASANITQTAEGKTGILIGSYDSTLYCLDAETGKQIWAHETDYYLNGCAAVANGKTVIGGCDAVIHVIATADGKSLKQIEAQAYIASSAVLTENHAFVGNYEGTLLCADIDAGEILWQYDGSDCAPYVSSPAVTDDAVIIGAQDKKLHAVNRADGKPKWTFTALGDIDSSPVVCGDRIVVGSSDGRIYIISLADGKEIYSYEIGSPIISSPAVAQGYIIVGAEDEYVYAFTDKNTNAE